MNEAAFGIFDYLPISKTEPESRYSNHLREAFIALDVSDNSGQAFSIMPFHLLFMLALQYKALRVANLFPQAADLFFAGVGGREKAKLLNTERSVFDFAIIHERTLPEIFRLVGMSDQDIGRIKSLIDDRNNNLAHAKGGIETDPEGKVGLYLDALRSMQTHFVETNDQIAKQWLSELSEEEALSEFIELRLPQGQLCLADFRCSLLLVFNMTDDLSLDEWKASASQVLDQFPQQGVLWLNHVIENHFDKDLKNFLIETVKKYT